MPISFKAARNLGLGILLSMILINSVLSYLAIHHASQNLRQIITTEEVRLSRYAEISELVTDARQSLFDYIYRKKGTISTIILNLDEVLRRLEIIKNFRPSPDELMMLNEISSETRRFKAAVLSYNIEVKEGYQVSTSTRELEQIIFNLSEDIVMLVRAISQGVHEHIRASNEQVLRIGILSEKLLGLILALSIIFALCIAFLMSYAISYPVHSLLNGTREIGKGNLGYAIKITSKDEFGELGSAFNNMTHELKGSHEELLRSKEILTRVTEGIEEGLMLLDTDFKIIWANKKIMNSSQPKEGGVLGNYCYRVTHHREEPCQPPDDTCPLNEVLKTKKLVTLIHTHFDKDGNKFFAEVTAYPLRDEKGEISQFIHVSRDITKRLELEQRLKENISVLERSQTELQKKVNELERFTNLAVDRELKMIELKKRIKELEGEAKDA